jgi:Flagellar capping protein
MARVSGLVSGLDTDALIQELVSAYQTKQDKYVKKQKKLEWTQEIWKGLNTKVYDFYTTKLRNMRFSSAYNLKKSTVSDSTKATVTASSSAVVGTQTLSVKKLAKTAYLTGGKLKRTQKADGTPDTTTKLTGNSKLSELGLTDTADGNKIKVNVNGKETEISVTQDMTINNFVVKLKDAGVNANFDDVNQRLFVNSSGSGKDKEFSITAANAGGLDALDKLGLNAVSTSEVKLYQQKAGINVQEQTDTAYMKYVLSQANADLNTQLSGLKDQYKYVTNSDYKNQKEEQWQKAIDGYDDKTATLDSRIQDILDWSGPDGTTGTDKVSDFVEVKDGKYVFKSAYLDTNGELDESALQSALTGTNMSVDDLKMQLGELNVNVAEKEAVAAYKKSVEDTRTLYQNALSTDPTGAALDTQIKSLEKEIDTNNKLMSQKVDFTKSGTINYTDLDKNSASMSYADLATRLNNYAAKVATANGETLEAVGTGLTAPASYKTVYDSYQTAYTNEKNQAVSELNKLGLTETSSDDDIKAALAAQSSSSGDGAVRVEGQDAEIVLNGATYTSTTNNFSVNGLTITATGEMAEGETITISTTADIDGMYDSIKSLISGFNDILKEMNGLYYADSAKGYEPLSDDEKEAMSDTEVEKWEKKIKDSLLRRDSTLSSIMGTIKNSMAKSYQINGKSYSLSSFGINTSGYFAVDNESRGLYHIDGDKDDSSTSGNTDKLRAALASDPDTVISFFQKLSDDMYTQLTKKMSATSLRSSYTIYNDKQLKKQYEEYDDIIDEWDDKIEKYTQKYVKQFTAMETALAKLQSSTSALSSLIG